MDDAKIPLECATVLMTEKTIERKSLTDTISGFLAPWKHKIFSYQVFFVGGGFFFVCLFLAYIFVFLGRNNRCNWAAKWSNLDCFCLRIRRSLSTILIEPSE